MSRYYTQVLYIPNKGIDRENNPLIQLRGYVNYEQERIRITVCQVRDKDPNAYYCSWDLSLPFNAPPTSMDLKSILEMPEEYKEPQTQETILDLFAHLLGVYRILK